MALQDVSAFVLMAAAAIYWLRSLARLALGTKRGCGSGCGKCSAVQPETTSRRIGLPQI